MLLRSFAAFGMLALALSNSADAAKVAERSKQKQAAEIERAKLQQKLDLLKRDIYRTETVKNRVADELAHSEAAISNANRLLHDLSKEQSNAETRLAELSEEQVKLATTADARQKQVAKLLRGQYITHREERIKLLLSGDNPNRINRELQYLGYVSRAQAKLIALLHANLQAVEVNRAEIQEVKDELDNIAREVSGQKAVLEAGKKERALRLSQLSKKLVDQRKEAGNLQRDEQRLAKLVEKLAKFHDEQAAKPAVRNELMREVNVQTGAVSQISQISQTSQALDAFGALRGQLRLPVKGELIAKFGSRRGDGPAWKGLFIRAAEGAGVKAVADGQVVFADWLRGFGNLVIIDHGNQYMTIYGNNQAVLKRAGDTVKTGDIIANAGNSGGNEQSGLYFEMRHQGRAFDPLEWVTLR